MSNQRPVLRRVRPGAYITPDGRFTVDEAYDHSAARRGRGQRYWVLSDTTGLAFVAPRFAATLAEARQKIRDATQAA